MGVRLRVDRMSCQSSGRCIAASPAVFAFDGDRLAQLREGAPELPLEAALEIARGCPGLAIDVLGEDGEPIDF